MIYRANFRLVRRVLQLEAGKTEARTGQSTISVVEKLLFGDFGERARSHCRGPHPSKTAKGWGSLILQCFKRWASPPNNQQTTFTYDVVNRLTKITYPTSPATFTQLGYDYRGRKTTVTDPNSKVTQYAYDDAEGIERLWREQRRYLADSGGKRFRRFRLATA
jgi:YD repeat-containing protein